MRFKKIIATTLMMGVIVGGTSSITSAAVKQNIVTPVVMKSVQSQINEFNQLENQIKNNRSAIIKADKTTVNAEGISTRAVGTYPTRKGVILVTRDGSLDKLVGHAGIVYNTSTTVESFPSSSSYATSNGVTTYSNNWSRRYSTVYGVTTYGTSATQDASAANIAYGFRGKPYNWNFLNTSTTSSFYCSQLVYRAYLNSTNKNLNQGGGIVFPIDLVQSSNTYTIYSK